MINFHSARKQRILAAKITIFHAKYIYNFHYKINFLKTPNSYA